LAKSLSSDLTFLVKFVVFPVSMTLFGGGALLAFFSPELIPSEWGRGVFVAGMLLGVVAHGAMYFCGYAKLKRVELDGNTLSLSNFFQDAETPLDNLQSVSGSLLMYPELVWLEFRQPTPFGKKIVFIGKYRFLAGWTLHPVVHELRNRLLTDDDNTVNGPET
jgi:hypothetical protein